MPNLKDLFPGLDPQDFGSGSAQVAQWAKGDDTSLIPADKLGSVDDIQTKLDGIEEGAEVNVNADWNSTSGDSQILNKPTDLATEGYVDSQVASLVDSSPEALDTLNELAAALGDDPNFATTTSDLIGTNASDIDAVELRLDNIEATDYVETSHTGDVDITGGLNVSGNVGIGNNSPTRLLTIGDGTGSPNIQILASTAGNSRIEFGDSDDSDAGELQYVHSDNSMRFTTNGSEAMRINSDGNVGIGIDNPSENLDVVGTNPSLRASADNASGEASLILRGLGSNGTSSAHTEIKGIPEGGGAASSLTFDTRNSSGTIDEKMRIDSDGKVGIGTTSPEQLLHLYGSGSNNVPLKIESAANTSFLHFVDANTTADYKVRLGSSGDNLLAWAGGAERMRIDRSGNVGIGENTPTRPLTVSGGTSTNTPILVKATSKNNAYIAFQDSGTSGELYNRIGSSSNALVFRANNAERMRINPAGNVGIGETNPSYKLDVHNGTAGSGIARFSGADSDDMIIVTESGYMAIDTRNTESGLSFQIQGDDKVRIDSSGNVGIGTESPSNNLHIKGDADGEGLTIQRNSTTSGAYADLMFSVSTSDNATPNAKIRATRGTGYDDTDISIITNSTERMRIDSAGNVGIGTESPATKLHVYGPAGNQIRYSSPNVTNILGVTGSDEAIIGTVTNHDLLLYSNSAEVMRINSDGNVGIGTDSPDSQLHLLSTSANVSALTIQDNDRKLELGRDQIAVKNTSGSVSNLYINPSGNTALATSSGSVGIGIATPSEKLEVDGTIKATAINFSGLPTSSTGLSTGDVWNDGGTLKIVS